MQTNLLLTQHNSKYNNGTWVTIVVERPTGISERIAPYHAHQLHGRRHYNSDLYTPCHWHG